MTPFFYWFFVLAAIGGFAAMIAVVAGIRSRRDLLANPLLTGAERPEALQAAAAALVDHVAQTPAALPAFLDAYLGDAAVAKREAWERAQADPEYLRQLAVDYLAKLDDAAVCRHWARWLGNSTARAGALDPRGRLARNAAAGCRLDARQRLVVYGGSAVLLLMLLVPPWVRRKEDTTRFLLATIDRKVLDERFVGYRFALAPGLPENESQSLHTGDLGKFRRITTRSLIATPILTLQLALLFASIAIGVYCARGVISAEPLVAG